MILPIITANINQKLPIIESEIALNGKVIQVMESSGTTQLRIAVNDDYDTVVLVEYRPQYTHDQTIEIPLIKRQETILWALK